MKNVLQYMKIGAAAGTGFAGAMLCVLSLGYLFAQEIQTFTSGQVVSASDINTNFANVKTSITDLNTKHTTLATNFTTQVNLKPPVGSIIAWHKTLTGVPALPVGWMECDGSTVNDPDSPLDGQVLPNLNGQRRFLRGNPTSGTLETDMFRAHTHAAPLGGYFHYVHGSGSTGGGGGGGIDGWTPNTMPAGGSETRPINMSVVWIIRVK